MLHAHSSDHVPTSHSPNLLSQTPDVTVRVPAVGLRRDDLEQEVWGTRSDAGSELQAALAAKGGGCRGRASGGAVFADVGSLNR